MNTACELREDGFDCGADFLEGFDAFGGDFARGVFVHMTVAGCAACLHGDEATHSTVLFVELAVDFHDLAGCLGAAGEQSAADDGVGERECFDDVAAFHDAAVGDDGDAFFCRSAAGDVERGELRDSDAGDDTRGADGAGALADFDDVGSARGEKFNTGSAGDIARDDGQVGKCCTDHFHRLADSRAVSVRCADGDDIAAALNECADMREDAVAVECAVGFTRGGDARTAEQSELRIARGLKL